MIGLGSVLRRRSMTRRRDQRRLLRKGASLSEIGQAMVESVFVIMLLCLIFWGFLQAALLYNHERVLQFASFAAARSATVGFQRTPIDYVLHSYRVAAIPASGAMLAPTSPGATYQNWTGANQQLQQLGAEITLIPLYLRYDPRGNLNYAYWDQYDMRPNFSQNPLTATMLTEQHDQEHPLEMPMVGAFYGLNRGTNATVMMMHNITTEMASQCQYYLQ